MAEHPNAAAIREMMDTMNSGDMEGSAKWLADDVVWHEIGNPNPVMGKAALAARMVGAEKPDYEITGELHDVVAGDDHTVALVIRRTPPAAARRSTTGSPRSTTCATARSPSAGRSRTTPRRSPSSSARVLSAVIA